MRIFITGVATLALLLSACQSPKPDKIAYDKDQCVECLMTISDSKFGAEIVTNKAKTYKFDSPECMLDWVNEPENISKDDVHSYWVTDFIHPGDLIDATTACYLQSEMIRSPMGLNVAAFSDENSCERARVSFPGANLSFSDVSAKAVSR